MGMFTTTLILEKMEKVLISVNNNLLIHEKVIELRLITDDALQFHFTWKIR